MERAKEREEAWSADGPAEGKWTAATESEENKENLLVNSELKDDLLLYQDEEELNASVISGERGPHQLVSWGTEPVCAVPGRGRRETPLKMDRGCRQARGAETGELVLIIAC